MRHSRGRATSPGFHQGKRALYNRAPAKIVCVSLQMLTALLAVAVAKCPRPNTTDNGQFCIPGPAFLYNRDDRRPPNSAGCIGTGLCGSGYHVANVRGAFCACDHGGTAPDPLLRQSTQYIRCGGGGAPQFATMRNRTHDLEAEDGDTRVLLHLLRDRHPTTADMVHLDRGSCQHENEVCVGFMTKVVAEGVPPVLWGVCQPQPAPGGDADPFLYPVENSRAAEDGGEPCDCQGRRPMWKSFRLKDATHASVKAINERVTGLENPEGPCESVRVGWGWDSLADSRVDPVVLTIPPGKEPHQIVREVKKTGTPVPLPAHPDATVPCGRQEHHPLGSMTLKEICARQPRENSNVAGVATYGDQYDVEASGRLYAVRNLMALDKRLTRQAAASANNMVKFLGLSITATGKSFAEQLNDAHTSGTGDRASYIFALALLHEEMRWGTHDLMKRSPPSFHGSAVFPSEVRRELHIGSRNFTGLIADADGTVSPFRLLMYHFSTSVLDYGVLINSWTKGSGMDFNAAGVRNYAGSFLGQPTPPDPSLPSGFHHYFMGLMPGILGRLTLPGGVQPVPDCHNPLLETLKKKAGTAAGMNNVPRVEVACKAANDLRANIGLAGLLMDPDAYDVTDHFPFVSTMTSTTALDEAAQLRAAAVVDLMEQLFQVIRYAMPDVLTAGFWESVYGQVRASRPVFDASALLQCGDPPRVVQSVGWTCPRFQAAGPLNNCYECDDVSHSGVYMKRCLDMLQCSSILMESADCNADPLRNLRVKYCTVAPWDGCYRNRSSAGVMMIAPSSTSTATCRSGLTSYTNASNPYTVFAADPTWSDRMWSVSDPDAWATLCETVHDPVPGIALPTEAKTMYQHDGCDLSDLESLFASASDKPLDFYDITAGCQVPTVLTYSLFPTTRLERTTRPVMMSEAVATAAWPGLPVERIAEYMGYASGEIGSGDRGAGGRCTALDEWVVVVDAINTSTVADTFGARACTMPGGRATVFDGTSACEVRCKGSRPICAPFTWEDMCLSVPGFGRASAPAHGFGGPDFNMTTAQFVNTVATASRQVAELAFDRPKVMRTDRDQHINWNVRMRTVFRASLYPHGPEMGLRYKNFFVDGTAVTFTTGRWGNGWLPSNQDSPGWAEEQLVAPDIAQCPDVLVDEGRYGNETRCMTVGECQNALRVRASNTADARLQQYMYLLTQTPLMSHACARFAAVGLQVWPAIQENVDQCLPTTPRRPCGGMSKTECTCNPYCVYWSAPSSHCSDMGAFRNHSTIAHEMEGNNPTICYDQPYDVMVTALSQDLVSTLASSAGTVAAGSGLWQTKVAILRKLHGRLSPGMRELADGTANINHATLLLAAQQNANTGGGDGAIHFHVDRELNRMDAAGVKSNIKNLMGARAVACKAAVDPLFAFGLADKGMCSSSTAGTGEIDFDIETFPWAKWGDETMTNCGLFNAADLNTSPMHKVRADALTAFLLRAHVRRGTPVLPLLRSKVMSPIIGCSRSTTHYDAPDGMDVRFRADCDRNEPGCVTEGGMGSRLQYGDFIAWPLDGYQTRGKEHYIGALNNTLRSVPIGTPALVVGHPDQTGQRVNSILFESDTWRQVPDYASLRAGTTANAPVLPAPASHRYDAAGGVGGSHNDRHRHANYFEQVAIALTGPLACHHGRCGDAVSTHHSGESRVAAELRDVETMSGRCYPGQRTPDQDTTALYRRRHFVYLSETDLANMADSDDAVYSVDHNGRATGFQPGGCRSLLRANPPPPPPPPPPPWWEAPLGVLLVVASFTPVVGEVFGPVLIAEGTYLIEDGAAYYEDAFEEAADAFVDVTEQELEVAASAASAVGLGGTDGVLALAGMRRVAASLDVHVPASLARDGTAYYVGAAVDTRPAQGLEDDSPTVCADPAPPNTDDITFYPQRAPLLLTKQEWETAGLAYDTQRGDTRGILVATAGEGVTIAQGSRVLQGLPGEHIPSFRQGEPDGVTLFDQRRMLFPRVWRLSARRRGAERQSFLDPHAAFGLSRPQLAAHCHAVGVDETVCREHRACGWDATAATCAVLAEANCDTDGDDRPCSHSTHPVCIAVDILPHEGMSLNAKGNLYTALLDANTSTTLCVPITERLVLTEDNMRQRFDEGHLWRPDCVYNPKGRGCAIPPRDPADLLSNFNLPRMSTQLEMGAPYLMFSKSEPAPARTWSAGQPMTAGGVGQDLNAHTQWAEQTTIRDANAPFATAETAVGLNCAADTFAADCGVLIDNVTKVVCPTDMRGQWPATCLKPELQLQTPADLMASGLYRGPFTNATTPLRRACPVYEPHSLDVAMAFDAHLPADACTWATHPLPAADATTTNAARNRAQYVHYCAEYLGLHAHCDNDYLDFAGRKRLCTEMGGALLYTGMVLEELSVQDVCSPSRKTCYVVPGAHGLGGVNGVLNAAAAAYGDLSGYTILITNVDVSVLKQLLLGATVEDVRFRNGPAATSEAQTRGCTNQTCLCCSRTSGACCTTCSEEDASAIAGERLITGQGLYERSAVLGRELCNRRLEPVDSLFRNISSLGELWKQSDTTYTNGVYTVVGIDYPDHNRDVNNIITHPAAAFEARVLDDGPIVVRWPMLTVRHIDPRQTVQFGAQRFAVQAPYFTLSNATFTGPAPAVAFAGTTAVGAIVSGVEARDADVAVAFLGGQSVSGEYSPLIDVSDVVVEHVVGGRFMVGLARAKGVASIRGCAATLSNACVVPHAYGDCRTWATAYGPPLDHAPGESWHTNTTGHLVGPGGPLLVGGEAVRHHLGKLHAGGRCVTAQGGRAVLVTCAVAPFASDTGHLEGRPFFCFKRIRGVTHYAPCAGCNVGLGRHAACDTPGSPAHVVLNRTHCIANGVPVLCTGCGLEAAACVPRPVGAQILGCTATPHGAVTDYRGGGTGVVAVRDGGGHGALWDADNRKVLVGGYGYAHTDGVFTQRVLVEPAEFTSTFDVRTSSAEVVNISAYTAVFGIAYERAVFHRASNTAALSWIGIVVFGSAIALMIVTHIYLTCRAWLPSPRVSMHTKMPPVETPVLDAAVPLRGLL